MDAETRIESYYDALEAAEPLSPFFASDDTVVKFGISEVLVGSTAIERGLREQTERTTDWTVDSRALRVTERECHAWFSDEVLLAWRDTTTDRRHQFETRWSGTIEYRNEHGQTHPEGNPVFVGMHVSTARSF